MVTEGPIVILNENEVSEQLGKMGIVDKATWPGDLPIEAGNILAKQYNMYVVEAMNQVLHPRIPEIWGGGESRQPKHQTYVPLYQYMETINRGDAATNNIDMQPTV